MVVVGLEPQRIVNRFSRTLLVLYGENKGTGPPVRACMGFGLADSIYADRVIIVTDNLVPFPAVTQHPKLDQVDV
jgi:citrate lyase alpha subunit